MALIMDKARTAGLVMEKKGLPTPPVLRVYDALDVSGSMRGLYRDGVVETAHDQILGAGLKLDDDGNVDTFIFDRGAQKIGTASASDAGTFVRNKLLPKTNLDGGTAYAPVIDAIHHDAFPSKFGGGGGGGGGFLSGLFGKKPAAAGSEGPVLAFLITDGDNTGEEGPARKALQASHDLPIYWNLVGIGSDGHFGFIRKAADEFDNVGFIRLTSLKMSDQAMYEALFTDEFITWAKKFPPRT